MMTQVDHLYEIMGMENKPYIVTKVVNEMVVLPASFKNSQTYHNEVAQELGYKLTFISSEFQVQFLKGDCLFASRVEELLFRMVRMDDIYDQYESSEEDIDKTVQEPR